MNWDIDTCTRRCSCKGQCMGNRDHFGPCYCGDKVAHSRRIDEADGVAAPVKVRVSWPETWMTVTRTIADRSYDPRLKVGAIVVSCDNTQLLSLGYNGNYKGGPHLHESSEPGKSGFIHAEVNALIKCDFNFPKQRHLYVTHSPCRDCAKLIINAEITRVVFDIAYRDTSGVDLMRSAGVEVLDLRQAVANERAR